VSVGSPTFGEKEVAGGPGDSTPKGDKKATAKVTHDVTWIEPNSKITYTDGSDYLKIRYDELKAHAEIDHSTGDTGIGAGVKFQYSAAKGHIEGEGWRPTQDFEGGTFDAEADGHIKWSNDGLDIKGKAGFDVLLAKGEFSKKFDLPIPGTSRQIEIDASGGVSVGFGGNVEVGTGPWHWAINRGPGVSGSFNWKLK
jgi:hypothetical protein